MALFFTPHHTLTRQGKACHPERKGSPHNIFNPSLNIPTQPKIGTNVGKVLEKGSESHFHKPEHLTEFIHSFTLFQSQDFTACACILIMCFLKCHVKQWNISIQGMFMKKLTCLKSWKERSSFQMAENKWGTQLLKKKKRQLGSDGARL